VLHPIEHARWIDVDASFGQQHRAERGKALGVWGAVAGSGGAVGVLLGGVLTAPLSWSWIFFVNVPVGLLAAALAPRLLPRSRPQAGDRSVNLAGGVSVTAGLAALAAVIALIGAPNVRRAGTRGHAPAIA